MSWSSTGTGIILLLGIRHICGRRVRHSTLRDRMLRVSRPLSGTGQESLDLCSVYLELFSTGWTVGRRKKINGSCNKNGVCFFGLAK